MANPNFGKDRILFFRRLDQAKTAAGIKMALQTEHTWNYSRSMDSVQTKDGAVATGGGLEVTLDIAAISSDDEVNKMLKQSCIDGATLEVWDVHLNEKTTENKFKAQYAQGQLESWEVPANVEDLIELSTSMIIDGVPQDGEVTLTEQQQEKIRYAFKDLVKETQ